jgi:2-keto-4-pentenoate hydratase/2-oxohepta-3-ene-1,7-dioic acid hydratase in catechol pathway
VRFATIHVDGRPQAALLVDARWVPLDQIDPMLHGDILTLIEATPSNTRFEELRAQAATIAIERTVPADGAAHVAPYRRPHKIWGIGLNYAEHAADLDAIHPDQPASFIKADHTIIGAGEPIVLPVQSQRVTAEAELGLVIGQECRNVSEDEALDALFGVCPILDQTAEDILQVNPRYLTRSKNFPTFFSFGPEIVTLDELPAERSLGALTVGTWRNGEMIRTQPVANMRHSPAALISFHSAIMPLYPGDVISSGTPGAVVIRAGDTVECRIDGLAVLANPVVGDAAP